MYIVSRMNTQQKPITNTSFFENTRPPGHVILITEALKYINGLNTYKRFHHVSSEVKGSSSNLSHKYVIVLWLLLGDIYSLERYKFRINKTGETNQLQPILTTKSWECLKSNQLQPILTTTSWECLKSNQLQPILTTTSWECFKSNHQKSEPRINILTRLREFKPFLLSEGEFLGTPGARIGMWMTERRIHELNCMWSGGLAWRCRMSSRDICL